MIDKSMTTVYWPNGKTSFVYQVVGFEEKPMVITLHVSDLALVNWLII